MPLSALRLYLRWVGVWRSAGLAAQWKYAHPLIRWGLSAGCSRLLWRVAAATDSKASDNGEISSWCRWKMSTVLMGEDKAYLRAIRQLMEERGVTVRSLLRRTGGLPQAGTLIDDEVFVTGNFGSKADYNFAQMLEFFDEHGKSGRSCVWSSGTAGSIAGKNLSSSEIQTSWLSCPRSAPAGLNQSLYVSWRYQLWLYERLRPEASLTCHR